jgi:acetyl esterase
MTQTNLSRPQGLNRIDPVLRKAAIDPGVVEFRAETLPVERERANFLAAQRAAAVDTDGVTVESRSIAGPDGQRLGLSPVSRPHRIRI